MIKTALITGITGQDGSYLADHLIELGYEVHGIRRRSSQYNTERINHLIESEPKKIHLHYADLADTSSLINVLKQVQPTEIYNLGAQSHVAISFEMPEYTADITGLGCLRLLDAIRLAGLEDKTRFYQASSSELYGLVQEVPQTETTSFYPRSPYACAKLFAYWTVINYREAYNMFACNGVLFNHESPRRGENFVTRKIARGLARTKAGLQEKLILGNLDSKRDWGHAEDYVRAMHLMLQQSNPNDYVISTGQQFSVRDFVNEASKVLDIALHWEGEGNQERGIGTDGKVWVEVSDKYFRASEVDTLLGDASRARTDLGWSPKKDFGTLVKEMVESEVSATSRATML